MSSPLGPVLSEAIQRAITKFAEHAGWREAARVLAAGAAVAEANQRELAHRRQVAERLTAHVRDTGQLPPGITQDLAQVANLPNIEQVGGRVAPPVITVKPQRWVDEACARATAVAVKHSHWSRPHSKPHCCVVDCPAPAVVAIFDTREKTAYDIAETHACADHVHDLGGDEPHSRVVRLSEC
jgi:hypothetical protein